MNIAVVGPLTGCNGISDVNRNLVLGLSDLGHSVRAVDLDDGGSKAILNDAIYRRLNQAQSNVLDPNDYYVIHNYNPTTLPKYHQNGAKKNVLITQTETNQVPMQWLGFMNMVDQVWLPSGKCMELFSPAIGRDKTRYFPYGVDTSNFNPNGPKANVENVEDDHFVFLTISEWDRRKGLDALLKAFAHTFADEPNTTLLMKVWKSDNFHLGQHEIAVEVKKIKEFIKKQIGKDLKCKIKLITHHLGIDQMAPLYRRCNAFVLPTRGEGFGNTILEAMACGLPTIITDTQNKSFMNSGNSILIPCVGDSPVGMDFSVVQKQPWYAGHTWREPRVESLSEIMRSVKDKYKDLGDIRDNAVKTAEEYSVKVMAETAVDFLNGVEYNERHKSMKSSKVDIL